MGAIGGLFGLNGGSGGTGFSTNPGTGGGQLNDAYKGVQNTMMNQQNLLGALQGQNALGNQSQVYNQLQGIANGTGPNPAQNMLNQATGANVANQAALMGGQRGAGSNVGLLARQAGQQGAGIQQQAAGQGATMQSQQALNAIGQAGGMANTMAANQIGQTNATNAAQQEEQKILQAANSNNNNIQGQLANTTMQGQQGIIGGLLQGAGGMFGAEGGVVPPAGPGYADGGAAFGPQSMFAQSLSSVNGDNTPTFGQSSGAESLQKGASGAFGKKKGPTNPMAGAQDISVAPSFAGVAAGGGKVPAMVSPGERFLKPQEAKAVAQGKANPLSAGEQIPGKAKVKGDSYQNDTVPKKLDVGGVVIPKSVMESKNPAKGAADFVRSVMAKKRVKA